MIFRYLREFLFSKYLTHRYYNDYDEPQSDYIVNVAVGAHYSLGLVGLAAGYASNNESLMQISTLPLVMAVIINNISSFSNRFSGEDNLESKVESE